MSLFRFSVGVLLCLYLYFFIQAIERFGLEHGTLSAMGGVFFLVAFIPYNIHLARGGQSAWVSWFIWVVLDVLTLGAMLAKGTANWQIIAATVGGAITLCFVIARSRTGWKVWKDISGRDIFCLAGASIGTALWLFSDASWGIAAFMATLLIGSWPIVQDAWKHPERESFGAWCLFMLSCVFAVMGVKEWSLAEAAQPASFFVIETVIIFTLLTRRAEEYRRSWTG